MTRFLRTVRWLIVCAAICLAPVCGFVLLRWLGEGVFEWYLEPVFPFAASVPFLPLPVLIWVLLSAVFPSIDRSWSSVTIGLFLVTAFSSFGIVLVAGLTWRAGIHDWEPLAAMLITTITFLPVLLSLLFARVACRTLRPGAFSALPSEDDISHSPREDLSGQTPD